MDSKFIFGFLFLLTLILVLAFWFWRQKIVQQQKQLSQIQLQQQKNSQALQKWEEKLHSTQISLTAQQKSLEKEETRINSLSENFSEKEKKLIEQIEKFQQKEQNLANLNQELNQKEKTIDKLKQEANQKLWEISHLELNEAQEILFSQLKEQMKDSLNKLAQQEIKQHQKKVEIETTKIICLALEKYSSELVYSKTVNYLKVNDSRTMGRIIGKDGRNINYFRKLTGVEVLINSENDMETDQSRKLKKSKASKPKSKINSSPEEWIIEISCFNSLRREIATRTLQHLIQEQRISPLQIESVFQTISKEVEKIIIQSGEEVLTELQINSLHPELVKYLGKLRFRTSYGQNVLEHCLEVAKLAGNIAAELGLEVDLARRAGLLHDIGKAVEDEGISHVISGMALAKQYHEPSIVINAIASHHRDFPADNFYSLIVSAADTLSAARPGARGQQLEAYLARMESLENLTQEITGVKKIYAFQAGREIWALVDTKKVADYQMLEIAKTIQKKIREQIVVPGEITISILRETKLVRKISTFPKKIN